MTRPKTGGRVQGTPNKTSSEMRELISNFIGNNLENLQSDFDQLDVAARAAKGAFGLF